MAPKENDLTIKWQGQSLVVPGDFSGTIKLADDGIFIQQKAKTSLHCYHCKKVNQHLSKDCPDKGKNIKSSNAGNPASSVAGRKSSSNTGNAAGEPSSLTKSQKSRRGLCWTCGKPGHIASACASSVTKPMANAGVSKSQPWKAGDSRSGRGQRGPSRNNSSQTMRKSVFLVGVTGGLDGATRGTVVPLPSRAHP